MSYIFNFSCKSILFLILFTSCSQEEIKHQNIESNTKKNAELKPKFDYTILEDGDIILKRGTGQVSKLMIKYLDEVIPLSHCGIISKNDTCFMVIHSIAKEYTGIDGVQKTELTYFMDDAKLSDTYIVRHKSSYQTRKKIATIARKYCDTNVPFDYDFDIRDSTKFYCSELIYHALKNAYKKEFFKRKKIGNGEALLLNSLLDTNNFETILN